MGQCRAEARLESYYATNILNTNYESQSMLGDETTDRKKTAKSQVLVNVV